MPNRRGDVVEQALQVLDRWGLADLSVRRLASELGVQPSALYHHFASKQALLAAVAEEILARGPVRPRSASWSGSAQAVCEQLRDAVLAVRDGAEVVATVHAFGLGASAPRTELTDLLRRAGASSEVARAGAGTLWHFVLGHATDEQTQLQADSAGAITGGLRGEDDFALGLQLVLDGLARHLDAEPAGISPR